MKSHFVLSAASFFVRDVGLRRLFGAGCGVDDVEDVVSTLLLEVTVAVTAVPLPPTLTLVVFLLSDVTFLLDDDIDVLEEAKAQINLNSLTVYM